MKFGIREICNVVFRAKSEVKIGSQTFKRGQPVLYIDSAKTSTLEGAATSVYATGGRGNTRLVTWEGEKTLTFTVEDALISQVGLSVLSGAGLLKGDAEKMVHVHKTIMGMVEGSTTINLADGLLSTEEICATAPLFALGVEADGSLTGETYEIKTVNAQSVELANELPANTLVMVDLYVIKSAAKVTEIQIDAENFAGYYYVEADTLFRAQSTGIDYPAIITLPNVKIQSNFSFSMASSGDPSTFTFTMDAMPGYTYFNPKKKVLCAIQVVDDSEDAGADIESVFPHKDDEGQVEIEGKEGTQDLDSYRYLSTSKLTMSGNDTEIINVKNGTVTKAEPANGKVRATVDMAKNTVTVITDNATEGANVTIYITDKDGKTEKIYVVPVTVKIN